jgi:hypothetical protein
MAYVPEHSKRFLWFYAESDRDAFEAADKLVSARHGIRSRTLRGASVVLAFPQLDAAFAGGAQGARMPEPRIEPARHARELADVRC